MIDLFGGTTCELDQKPAAGYVSDFTGGVWLCSVHLARYETAWRSIGRTVSGFLRMPG
jgi:hypothetical protein